MSLEAETDVTSTVAKRGGMAQREWRQKRLGCCWASSLASLPQSCPLPVWAIPPAWSSSAQQILPGAHAASWESPVQSLPRPQGRPALQPQHSPPSQVAMCTLWPASSTEMPCTFLPSSQDKTEVSSPSSLMVEPAGAGVEVEEGEGERQAEIWGWGERDEKE